MLGLARPVMSPSSSTTTSKLVMSLLSTSGVPSLTMIPSRHAFNQLAVIAAQQRPLSTTTGTTATTKAATMIKVNPHLRHPLTQTRISPRSPALTLLAQAFQRHPTSSVTTSNPVAEPLNVIKRLMSTSQSTRGPRSYYKSGSTGRSGGNRRRGRVFESINRLSPNLILYTIMGLNVIVFLLWSYAKSVYVQFRDSSWLRFMTNHFTCSMRNLEQGRIWTLLTSCFSHAETSHIFVNLLSLYFVAQPVMMVLGNVGFLSLYLTAGVISSIVSITFAKFSKTSSPMYQSLGASGSVYGTLACFGCMFPTTTFLLFFVVPVPAWLCIGGIFAWDCYGALYRRGGTTDSAGHVGGILAGAWWALRIAGRF
ncbi:hypothetical protein OIO90_002192 [Microbotryomycetes sp. JL221]|nr:hypothetical protein OIO90_002192 [Microbotryomycetes sp. JL221]